MFKLNGRLKAVPSGILDSLRYTQRMSTPAQHKSIYNPTSTRLAYVQVTEGLAKNKEWEDRGPEKIFKQALLDATPSISTLWEIYNYFLDHKAEALGRAKIATDLLSPPAESFIFLVDGKTIRIYLEYELELSSLEALKIVPGIIQSVKNRHYWQSNADPGVLKDSLRSLLSQHGFRISPEAVEYLKTENKSTKKLFDKSSLPVPTSTLIKKDSPNTPPAFIRSETPLGTLDLGKAGRPAIKFYKTEPALAEEVKRYSGVRWSGEEMAFIAPASRLKELAGFARKYNLLIINEAKKIVDSYSAPLNYDGTFNGLRGVPLTDLFVIDENKANRFHAFGVDSVWDLLNLIPYRYIDRSDPLLIKDLQAGVDSGLIATITDIAIDHHRRMLNLTASDKTGKLRLTYFNAVWMAKKYKVGDEVVIYGRVDEWRSPNGRSTYSMVNPIVEILGESTVPIVPVYRQSDKAKVTTQDIHLAAYESLERLGELTDSIPVNVREKYNLIPRVEALKGMHLPQVIADTESGRQRLAFDELFRMQLALLSLKKREEAEMGIVHKPTGKLTEAFVAGLPFDLTGAQTRVAREIREEMTKPTSSRIMIQADVGAGKTAVGLFSMLAAVEGGYQAALLGPTTLLSTQLFLEAKEKTEGLLVGDNPLRVEFFHNKLKAKERRELLSALAEGHIHLAVGTHSLLSDDVEFQNLGLVIVDEQQKFGTLQRSLLIETKGPVYNVDGVEKRARPDLLLMSATPIPRSSAMVFFGDLKMAIIDELPPGRIPVKTEFINSEIDLLDKDASPWKEVREEVKKGFQGYVICALVEENEKLELASVKETFEGLSNGALSGLRVAMVYGKQDPQERKTLMDSYKNGEIDVLIGSSVLEVGISVARATIMVILDPTRFGLSTLHQARGRVGRAQFPSRCFLYGKAFSSDALERMEILVATNDGFKIAEKDLELRGSGTVFGESQSGVSDLRVADLFRDKDLIELAREAATEIIELDPTLERRPGLKSEIAHMLGEGAEEWLVKT